MGGLCASGWGNVKNVFENVLLAGEMLKGEKPTFDISPVGAFLGGGLCASGWGNVKNFFENVLLAGEMLKSAKAIFNISPVGGLFFEDASGWGNVKYFFENVLLAGEILKKLKMLKVGGTMFVHTRLTNIVPPTFNIFYFLEFLQPEAHFQKKKL